MEVRLGERVGDVEGYVEVFLVFIFKRNRIFYKGVKLRRIRRVFFYISFGISDFGSFSLFI